MLGTIDAELAGLPGLAVAGATYRGVGIPAVIVWLILQFWALVTLPVRAARWQFGRAEARAS